MLLASRGQWDLRLGYFLDLSPFLVPELVLSVSPGLSAAGLTMRVPCTAFHDLHRLTSDLSADM